MSSPPDGCVIHNRVGGDRAATRNSNMCGSEPLGCASREAVNPFRYGRSR